MLTCQWCAHTLGSHPGGLSPKRNCGDCGLRERTSKRALSATVTPKLGNSRAGRQGSNAAPPGGWEPSQPCLQTPRHRAQARPPTEASVDRIESDGLSLASIQRCPASGKPALRAEAQLGTTEPLALAKAQAQSQGAGAISNDTAHEAHGQRPVSPTGQSQSACRWCKAAKGWQGSLTR